MYSYWTVTGLDGKYLDYEKSDNSKLKEMFFRSLLFFHSSSAIITPGKPFKTWGTTLEALELTEGKALLREFQGVPGRGRVG